MYGNEDLKGMGKTVVMFPGQGSQCTGMGRESYNSCTSSVKCFKKAGELTGINMEHLIFEENDLLDKTEYTQIALYVTEISQLADMVEQGLTYDAAIGLSLGEYSALTASGALSYEDGVRLVRNRGIYMEQEVPWLQLSDLHQMRLTVYLLNITRIKAGTQSLIMICILIQFPQLITTALAR